MFPQQQQNLFLILCCDCAFVHMYLCVVLFFHFNFYALHIYFSQYQSPFCCKIGCLSEFSCLVFAVRTFPILCLPVEYIWLFSIWVVCSSVCFQTFTCVVIALFLFCLMHLNAWFMCSVRVTASKTVLVYSYCLAWSSAFQLHLMQFQENDTLVDGN